MFEVLNDKDQSAVIKVIGVGGGGGNAIEHMVAESIEGVEFIIANTDAQAVQNSSVKTIIQLGELMTKGLGAGANPDVGRRAAEEDHDKIRSVLHGSDMVFITCGMGGGTGTGASPVIAEIAKSMDILTVAIVTKPFSHEGKQRMAVADEGIENLAKHVDSLITIPNDKLLSVLGSSITLLNAFKSANGVLQGAVQGIAELITRPGLINVDFADVRTVMSEMGMAVMGTGSAIGEHRAKEAAEIAVSSPLLEDVNFDGAKGVLINITVGGDISLGEFKEVGDVVKDFVSDNATVVIGTVIDDELHDEMRVTVIVTGINNVTNERKIGIDTKRKDGTLDYNQLEKPTVIRKQGAVDDNLDEQVPADVEYLDIPAFLRRKHKNNL
ncbi:MAG: cell division protein FtsZ [Legionellales bacterium]|nr:cell division protein FtsZ [Legionellales bacterium]